MYYDLKGDNPQADVNRAAYIKAQDTKAIKQYKSHTINFQPNINGSNGISFKPSKKSRK